MISRPKTGRSFGGLARYLVQGHKDQQERSTPAATPSISLRPARPASGFPAAGAR